MRELVKHQIVLLQFSRKLQSNERFDSF